MKLHMKTTKKENVNLLMWMKSLQNPKKLKRKIKKINEKKKNLKRRRTKKKIMEKELTSLMKGQTRHASGAQWLTVDNEPNICFWDTTGDKLNLLYGSLYPTDTPLYYRAKFCIGLATDEKIIPLKTGYIIITYDSNRTVMVKKKVFYI